MKTISMRGSDKPAIVDDEDYPWLVEYTWFYHHGSIVKHIMTNRVLFRLIMSRVIMNCPKGMVVDHINHNPLDNRKCNLRIVTGTQNTQNARGHGKRVSKYKGVRKHHNRWVATIRGKYIGIRKTQESAAMLYNEWAKKLYGEFGFLNPV